MVSVIEKAALVAKVAHRGQTRWDKSVPYITHPEAVAKIVRELGYGEFYQAVAWLHDIVEDTSVTIKGLREAGFDGDIVHAVAALTKHEGVSYLQYLLVVKTNRIARVVKLADLTHNMSDLKDGARKSKYELAYYILS